MKKNQRIRNRSREKKTAGRFSGVFSATSSGFGFVSAGNGSQDLFIPAKYTHDAMDGDLVEAELLNERDSRGPAGRIVRIAERRRRTVVGRLGEERLLMPLEERLNHIIRVTGPLKGAKAGDWIKVRLAPAGKSSFTGTVEALYGKSGSIAADLQAVAAQFELCPPYTDAENAAAEEIVPMSIPREDLTKLPAVTLDPADAKDFDDAISISRGNKPGETLVGVHIADVAVFIRANTKFDRAAAKRGFSSYMPGMFLPMLPKKLTGKISLKQDQDSPAHSILFTLRDRDAKILSVRRCHSVIRVKHRLNYDEVQAYLDSGKFSSEWKSPLRILLKKWIALTAKVRARRKAEEHFLNIETHDVRVLVDHDTLEIKGLLSTQQRESEQLVEEWMLAANSAIAAELLKRHVPGIFRVHPEPEIEKLEEFSSMMFESFGIRTMDLSERKNCERFLEHIPDDHRKGVITSAFLRSLPRAHYSAEEALHYGLGKYEYVHFTSPIRRYTDLTIHRQLLALDLNKSLKSKEFLQKIAFDCSGKEERIDNAYFEANDRLKLHYLRQQGVFQGEEVTLYEGVITKITNSVLLCDLPQIGIYGAVKIGDLRSSAGFRKSKKSLKARCGHTTYKVGDILYLVPDSLDLLHGKAWFRPV